MKTYVQLFMLIASLTLGGVGYADTYIHEDHITKDVSLVKSKSPYIIDHPITIDNNAKMKIEDGVKIIFTTGSLFFNNASLTGDNFKIESQDASRYDSLISGSHASIQITHVKVSTARSFVSVWNYSDINISYIDMETVGEAASFIGIQAYNSSSVSINNAAFSRFTKGMDIFNSSHATITDSVFEYNQKAIYTFNSHVIMRHNDFLYNKIAVEFFLDDGVYGVTDAQDNWWGNANRPKEYLDSSQITEADVNVLLGNIIYAPWSLVPNKKSLEGNVSNVLFLPGLMGSRLYQKGIFENQLWEPNRNKDVTKLYLDRSGNSIEKNIYTRDVLAKTNIAGGIDGIDQSVYKEFFTYMDNLVAKKVIQEWEAAPYDWRYSPDILLEQGISTSNGDGHIFTNNLVAHVLLLAKTSKTKKVTLITHSNGGLVAKQLMIELKNRNLDMLVDKIIFVAMPEYGTPQAITSLLYGHEQSIAGGVILSTSIAQKLGINMPTAYTLLPSVKYFESEKNILFGSSTLDSKSSLNVKLTEKADINNSLLHKADQFHQSVDIWVPPPYVLVYQLVGTGLLTVSDVMEQPNGKPVPVYTSSGDGVVQDMYDTALHRYNRTGVSLTVDLHSTTYKHANIMNYGGVLQYVDALLHVVSGVQDVHPTYSSAYTLVMFEPKLSTTSSSRITSKNISVQTSTEKDSLIHTASSQYDITNNADSLARYDLFGSNLQYISQKSLDSMLIQEQTGNTFNLHVFKKDEVHTKETVYENIEVFADSSIVSSIPTGQVEILIPLVSQKIEIAPTKEITYDQNNIVVSEKFVATTTEDFPAKISRIKLLIITSNITSYIRSRYLTRLDTVLKSKDIKNLNLLQERAVRAVSSIDAFANSPALKGRYAKLRQDYIYLSYILK